MAAAVFPAPSAGGGIKSVQRGSAGGAGTVTITAVDISKSFVNVFGTASSGTVAATGAIAATTQAISATTHSMNASSGNIAGYSMSLGNRTAGNGQSSFIEGSGGPGSSWAVGTVPSTTFTGSATNGNIAATNGNIAATNISGGSNNLVAAVVQGYLSGSTSLVVSGACRWEVVEFN